MSGVFAVDRRIFDHPIFAPEPYTEREAWLWLVGAAVWKVSKVRAGRKLVALERGQLAFSERFLAEKWKWPKTSVRRFLNRLKSEAMVCLLADRDTTIITICNYEKYAFDGTTRGPRTGPQGGPLADHSRTKEEEGKELKKEELKEESSLRSDVRETVSRVEREAEKRATRLPEDWQPSVADIEFAKANGHDAISTLREATKFKNHWLSKGGKDAKKTDWPRTWQNWILNDYGGKRGPPQRQPQPSFHEIAAEIRNNANAGNLQSTDDQPGKTIEGELFPPPKRAFG